MKLKVRTLYIEAGGRPIVVLNKEDAKSLGIHAVDRIEIKYKDKRLVAITNISTIFPEGYIGLYKEVCEQLKVSAGEDVDVKAAPRPASTRYIQAKIHGKRLLEHEIKTIIRDVVERRISDIELSAFVTALYIHGLSMNEKEALTKAMVETGKKLNIKKKPILDKHSIGGIPGDKTTIVLVPIVAAAGYTIPKTSSRAITSPAGTADRMEVLCPVNLSLEEIEEVINKVNACIVWGGALDLAPADDLFIQVEYPLAIDPLLLPSIISKKKAMGADYVVIDIPTGREAKIKTIDEAHELAKEFIELGKRLGMNIQCAITFGEQPLGYAIGPALEAREALLTLMGKGPEDLEEKAINLARILFEMVGESNGKEKAREILRSGLAERKLREIIEAQGGNPKIKVEDIPIGPEKAVITAVKEGKVFWINNRDIAHIARAAGAPKDKGAGILLNVKLGDFVKKGDKLFTIYAERLTKLEEAIKLTEQLEVIGISKDIKDLMLIERIPTEKIHEKTFILER